MSNQILISELVDEEREIVRSLLIESYQQYEEEYSAPELWQEYLENIRSSVDNPYIDKIFVAKDGEEILGTIQIFKSSEEAYGKPELQIFSPIIRLLAVHPNARSRGVAQQLLDTSINYAKSIGAVSLFLHTSNKMQKAIRLYEWLGFKRDKEKEFEGKDVLVMCYRLDL
ncbi:GNAT family N-acetyltransferase [Metabacillus fastidiosus]|uniref:GNAT family N-acetyltransferase n=1 Tax=Metabacillus fastidiosus TaxID=1458 RepID=A0ABU6P301_9BACI|nr:GNAT family N-acetyltransferase [Metabacillus fastidiosus]MED4403450.1 GNAT family N-acetyltransferase [Metabacillus fastidiosus]MED4460804.1 GNAT family N-acetyltransferase [Metabacillus fastidiosus]